MYVCPSLSPTQVNAASEEEREEESSSSPEHPLAHEGLISPPVSAVAPKWSIAKPPSPPQSRMPLPQSVGRRGLSQHSSPKADSPDQVEGLELALEAQAKVADMKKAHQEELDRYVCTYEYGCSFVGPPLCIHHLFPLPLRPHHCVG